MKYDWLCHILIFLHFCGNINQQDKMA